MAELADALRSGRSELCAHVGSNPTFGIACPAGAFFMAARSLQQISAKAGPVRKGYVGIPSAKFAFDLPQVRTSVRAFLANEVFQSFCHPKQEPFDFALRRAQGKLKVNTAEAKDPYDEANAGIFQGILRCFAPQHDIRM